jgi:hypothetical protein
MSQETTNPAGQGEVCEECDREKNDCKSTPSSRTAQEHLCEFQTTKLRQIFALTRDTAAAVAALAWGFAR